MNVKRGAKILIRRRSDGKYLILTSSLWLENPERSQQPDLPGGVIEPNEMIEEGLLREIEEETGIELTHDRLTLGYSLTYADGSDSRNFFVFISDITGEEHIQLSWEHERFEWLSADEIMALKIRQPYSDIFQYLKKTKLIS